MQHTGMWRSGGGSGIGETTRGEKAVVGKPLKTKRKAVVAMMNDEDFESKRIAGINSDASSCTKAAPKDCKEEGE